MNHEALIEKLSVENIDSFAFAAQEIHEVLRKRYGKTPIPIVVPSRGAHPIFCVANQVPYFERQFEVMKQEEEGDLEPKYYNLNSNPEIYIPFTSDYQNDQGITTKKIRKYWVSVMLSLLKGKESDCFALYKTVNNFFEETFGIVGGSDIPIGIGQEDEFVLIDTCISGRAICEIVESLRELGCEKFFILAIKDKSKGDLAIAYQNLLYEEVGNNRLQFIEVKDLFTEDQSPLLNMGCGSVVFPELMEACYDRIQSLQELDAVGAGCCILNHNDKLRGTSLNAIRSIIQHFIYLRARQLSGFKEHFRTDSQLEAYMREQLHNALKESGDDCLQKEKTKSIFSELSGIDESRLDVSSSHVVRCKLSAREINDLISLFQQS